MTTKHATTHPPRSFGVKILTLLTGFAVLLWETLKMYLNPIQRICNNLKKLLRCSIFVLATIPVLTLTNLMLADSASAGHPHYVGGTWTTFQTSANSPNAFTHNKKINEMTLGYASSYSFQDGANSNSYLRLHVRATGTNVVYRVLTYLNGATVDNPLQLNLHNKTTAYGTTTRHGNLGQCGNKQYSCWEIRFHPNVEAFNSLERNQTVRIVFDIRHNREGHWHNVRGGNPELIITRNNSGIEWKTGSTGSYTKQPTPTIFSEQYGKITTYATGSNLQFKSQLFDNNTTAVEATLTREERIADWNGQEWTTNTTYGRWIVGNETDCSSEPGNSVGAKCYDVKFEPNDSALNALSKRNIKVSLLSNELLNSTVVDTQTLSYTFTSQADTEISLGTGETDSENINFYRIRNFIFHHF